MKGTSPPPFSCQRPRPCGYGAKRLDARGPCRPWPAGGGAASLHRRPALRRQALRRSRSRAPKPSPPPCRAEGRPARVARGAPAAMSAKRLQQQVEALSRSARHFNKNEVECLIKLFDTLVTTSSDRFGTVGFDRNMFRDTLHRTFGMTDDMVMDRVFRTFDRDNDSCISVEEWVEGLSVFLRGTLEERIKYCFEVYDLNGDGYISREEMFQMLKNSLLKQPSEEDPDEGIKDLVDIALKKMDHDHDGKLSFADFEKAVRDDNLLLEAFGPCLPDIKGSLAFEKKTFKGNRKL